MGLFLPGIGMAAAGGDAMPSDAIARWVRTLLAKTGRVERRRDPMLVRRVGRASMHGCGVTGGSGDARYRWRAAAPVSPGAMCRATY